MVCTGSVPLPLSLLPVALNCVIGKLWDVYFEKIRVFKAGLFCALNIAAWNNGIGSHKPVFVGFCLWDNGQKEQLGIFIFYC
jgi:hypothetical protein